MTAADELPPLPMPERLSLPRLTSTLSRFRKVLGPRGMRWLLACFLSSLSLSLVEYALAAFLQVFLVSLGYFNHSQISPLLLPLEPPEIAGVSPFR